MTKRGDKKFTLYWKTGDREVIEGRDVAEAMTLAGYSGGALGALELWARGDDHKRVWNPETREWDPTPESPLGQAIAQAANWKP